MGSTAAFLRKLQEHKLVTVVFTFLLILTISYFYGFFSTEHLFNVFLTNPINSKESNNFIATTLHYIGVVIEIEGLAFLGISMFSLLTPLNHILVSEKKIDPAVELSFKSLILIATKSARSLLVTWFNVRLLKLGYIFVVFLVFHENLLQNYGGDQQSQLCALPSIGTLVLVVGAVFFYAYLAVVWNMALVVSVNEEKSGVKAFEKASQLLEGRRKLHGFLINLVIGVFSVMLFAGWMYLITCANETKASKGSINMSILNYMCLIELWTWTFFTMLYFMCKKTRGEEIQLPGSLSLKHILQEQQPLINGSAQIV